MYSHQFLNAHLPTATYESKDNTRKKSKIRQNISPEMNSDLSAITRDAKKRIEEIKRRMEVSNTSGGTATNAAAAVTAIMTTTTTTTITTNDIAEMQMLEEKRRNDSSPFGHDTQRRLSIVEEELNLANQELRQRVSQLAHSEAARKQLEAERDSVFTAKMQLEEELAECMAHLEEQEQAVRDMKEAALNDLLNRVSQDKSWACAYQSLEEALWKKISELCTLQEAHDAQRHELEDVRKALTACEEECRKKDEIILRLQRAASRERETSDACIQASWPCGCGEGAAAFISNHCDDCFVTTSEWRQRVRALEATVQSKSLEIGRLRTELDRVRGMSSPQSFQQQSPYKLSPRQMQQQQPQYNQAPRQQVPMTRPVTATQQQPQQPAQHSQRFNSTSQATISTKSLAGSAPLQHSQQQQQQQQQISRTISRPAQMNIPQQQRSLAQSFPQQQQQQHQMQQAQPQYPQQQIGSNRAVKACPPTMIQQQQQQQQYRFAPQQQQIGRPGGGMQQQQMQRSVAMQQQQQQQGPRRMQW